MFQKYFCEDWLKAEPIMFIHCTNSFASLSLDIDILNIALSPGNLIKTSCERI